MRVYFTNLGCKLNQAEVDAMSRRFVAAGHRLAPTLDEAELHVVNSCTVTHLAARDSRKIARRGGRKVPELRTVLTGCYATDAPDEAAALAGVDLVVTNDRKDQLLDLVHEAFPDALPVAAADTAQALDIPYVPLDFGLSRALVKVEDGCNMRCSFCIIPSTRGRQRSRTVEEVVAEVDALARGGYAEVVVTGVQISEYLDETGPSPRRLFDLVRALLERTDVLRLRLTSIAPWKFDHRLLELWQDERLCRHIHMSLQSGSTATLRRMRRPYTADQYEELAATLRGAIPGLALTTDVIVGFPGETDTEFAESLAFVERLAFAKPHVFTYSLREGTHAAELPDQVDHQVKKARVAEMLRVGEATERAFRESQIGTEATVVWEGAKSWNGGTVWTGLTDHYVRVFADEASQPRPGVDLSGRLDRVRLQRAVGEGGWLEARRLGRRTIAVGTTSEHPSLHMRSVLGAASSTGPKVEDPGPGS